MNRAYRKRSIGLQQLMPGPEVITLLIMRAAKFVWRQEDQRYQWCPLTSAQPGSVVVWRNGL